MTDEQARACGVGMIGYAFMGAAHSQALAQRAAGSSTCRCGRRWPWSCGRDEAAVDGRGRPAGLGRAATDWRALVARDDIDLVDICTRATPTPRSRSPRSRPASTCCARSRWPTRSRRPRRWSPRPAAPRAGGWRWWASPTAASRRSRWPAHLVADGRIGTVRHVRAQYLQDWLADPQAPLSWRLDKEKAGSGALGDIGAHIIDLAQFVTGERSRACPALLETFVKERPIAGGAQRTGAATAPATGDGPGHRGRRRAVLRPVGRRRARRRSRRPGSRWAARTPSGSRSTGRAASSRSTSRT